MTHKALYRPVHFENPLDLPKPALTGHQWLQRGVQLICQSCPFEHSHYLKPNQIFRGLDENGAPKIETLS